MLGTTGVMSLESVFSQVRQGAFAGHGTLLTFAGICLFFGAVGKSAQFPLHVWLPDAMEGPTPVSALIHAATMVAAGVYLVGRIFPLLTPTALLFVAYIGAITLIGSALIAIVMTDIKRVLAYSTISQLGYMMLALGRRAVPPDHPRLLQSAAVPRVRQRHSRLPR
jgi:NADH-quinone oxidoreductase subunit L